MLSASLDLQPSEIENRVVEMLRRHGALRVRRFVPQSVAAQIGEEFEVLHKDPPGSRRHVTTYRPGLASAAVVISRSAARRRAPVTHDVFSSPWMEEVSRGFLGARASSTHTLYLTRDVADPTPVTGLHFDRIHALKFYLYVDDTDERSGALGIVPGSHAGGRRQRTAQLRRGRAVRDLDIIQRDHEGAVVTLAGRAGTLIVFDTDVLHQGA